MTTSLRAARKGLWTELRLDYLTQPDLPRLFRTHPGPVIATNRLAAEGGQWTGNETARRGLLEEALNLGADFLDRHMIRDSLLVTRDSSFVMVSALRLALALVSDSGLSAGSVRSISRRCPTRPSSQECGHPR